MKAKAKSQIAVLEFLFFFKMHTTDLEFTISIMFEAELFFLITKQDVKQLLKSLINA